MGELYRPAWPDSSQFQGMARSVIAHDVARRQEADSWRQEYNPRMIGAVPDERRYVVEALDRYWPAAHEAILALPIPVAAGGEAALPPVLERVALPEWAAEVGVDGRLLVPAASLTSEGCDWLAAALWFLNGTAERVHEARRGPIHGYSFRLAEWDPAQWERAWVNRIALFLRRWAEREGRTFAPLPAAELLLTHDLDAVEKTAAIRAKQGAFNAFNAARELRRGKAVRALGLAGKAARFLLGPGDFAQLEAVARREEELGLRSTINVHGSGGGWTRSPRALLLDPGYDANRPDLARTLSLLSRRGFRIGLHPGYATWDDATALLRERSRVEEAAGTAVVTVRQHWLRFGWERTWAAQEAAGLGEDSSLGFNDRPGFRAGAALRFHPWDPRARKARRIAEVPLVLMDSHLHDYRLLGDEERPREMRRWIDEVRAVRGVATVLWHPHTLSPDYGWRPGFEELLAILART